MQIMEINLSQESNETSLKNQFRKMCLKYHPDRNNGDSSKFIKIKEAYDILLKQLRSPTKQNFIPFQMFYGGGNSQFTGSSNTFNWTWNGT